MQSTVSDGEPDIKVRSWESRFRDARMLRVKGNASGTRVLKTGLPRTIGRKVRHDKDRGFWWFNGEARIWRRDNFRDSDFNDDDDLSRYLPAISESPRAKYCREQMRSIAKAKGGDMGIGLLAET
ncbi:hypothetical protein HN011_007496 [Eciton burchellii]|nr:hypothetical protein HN011_007496 [Eciton burchellii]